jgi:hypothetical protein
VSNAPGSFEGHQCSLGRKIMAKKDVKRGIRYEKEKAKEHGAKHIGGPGMPDYQRGKVKGEVKNRQRKVTKPELQEMAKKGIKEVESKAGFTKPAIEYRDKHRKDIKLLQGCKEVKKED